MKDYIIPIGIVFVFFVFVGTGQEGDYSIAPMERREREGLYYAIQGFVGKWWNGSDLYPDPCGWTPIQGVSCDLYNGSWYVTSLNIGPVYDNSLVCAPNAQFTHHLFELKHLKSLSFYNCFSQKALTIPLSNWENLALETLEFRSNPSLTGEIPTTFGSLKSLQSLVLLENGLTGQLPMEMVNLVNLKRLSLSGNRIVGQIPATWGSLNNLLILDLSRNFLSGPMPWTFGGLTSLLKLDLSQNLLEGKLPMGIGNLKNLTLLDLSNNKFSGGLPQNLHEMVSLQEMEISNNPNIGGDLLGIQWESFQNLEFLDLSDMGLRGTVPNSMTELKRLRFLGLTNNSLSGTIPPRFEAMPCISAIYLHGNNFSGRIEFSESFYGKMGSRFRASGNPNLCYSVGLKESSHVPFGVKHCQEKESNVESMEKMSDGFWKQNSHFVASLGFPIRSGFNANKIVVIFLVWIMLF
ncbi:Piriformospora indica-insensitive protein [Actinidia chinensis var. chinensis]|uniref:Piriformospora indica-insensitive protein n=1 Tax=Actinidia chinensis var. chinensis TaxID=1590841 RepID=A0A2R6PU30_ACTCC|nr:Piriformospora indica-insensitive protein [Actinidia chinensis var. chinensis]